MDEQKKFRVFVYGTLKKGGVFHHLLQTSKYVGDAKVHGTMYSLGDFPAIVLVGNTDVKGEIYEINEDTLERLDRLEGYPGFYDRQTIKTSRGDAIIYFHQWDNSMANCPIVKSGNWPVNNTEEEYA